jgi:hypothetical protein
MGWPKLSWIGLVVLMVGFIQLDCLAKNDDSKSRRLILVVVGAAGEEEFGKAFRESAERWRAAFQSEDFLMLDGTDATKSDEKDHRQQILDWIAKDEPNRTTEEPIKERWLVLIGHGTNDRKGAKFNLKGPDISSETISKAISTVKARWIIMDGSSSSGPFINSLSGENRIVITATKSGAEQNYARFGEYLSKAITDRSADLDHDDCVSILEAFLAASNRVSQYYEDAGRLASEQALLDDNGDSRGTPAAFYRGARPVKAPANGLKLDGALASRMIASSFGKPDLRTVEQRAQCDTIADQIESLRSRKNELVEHEYYQELERLFLAFASANRTGAQ